MADERPLDVVHGGPVDGAEIDRRPSWIWAGVAALVALVVVVTVATRDGEPSVDDVSLPATTQPPAIDTDEPEPSATSVAPELSDETLPEPANNPDSGQLPLSDAVPAALPPGGIDGWMFSLDGLSRLTRTDLTTGEESRISLRDESRSEFEFILSQSRLVQIGDKVVWAGPDFLYLVHVETMQATAVEYAYAPAVMVTNDDNTVWLRTFELPNLSSSVFSIDTTTLAVSEPFGLDPLDTGVVVAGASNGVLRYFAPFGGSWELDDGSHRRVDTAIVAGTNGGTLEVRCEDGPDDCTTLVHDMTTGMETPIDSALVMIGAVLSPTLGAVVTAGNVVSTDGTVLALPHIGEWTWSSDGRFLTSDDLTVVDLTGEHAPFQLPAGGRSTPRQEALVILRPAN